MKWISIVLSLAIAGAFWVFYFIYREGKVEDLNHRNLRLLATAEQGLHDALGGKAFKQGRTRYTWCPTKLAVEVHPSVEAAAQAPAPRCENAEGGKTEWVSDCTPQSSFSTPLARGSGQEHPKQNRSATEVNPISLDFSQILEFIPRHQDAFDKVLLTDAGGRVLEQSEGAEAPKILTLLGLKELDQKREPSGKGVDPDRFGGSTLEWVRLGERNYQLFCQPTLLSSTGATALDKLHFCGLLSETRLNAETLRVSPLLVCFLTAILALGLLIPPFFRTHFLSATQRFRFVDAYALAACTVSGLVLYTLVLSGLALHFWIQRTTDRELEDAAMAVEQQLREEVADAQYQLEFAESELRCETRREPRFAQLRASFSRFSGAESEVCLDDHVASFSAGFATHSTGSACPNLHWPSALPELKSLIWITADGAQRLKWTTEDSRKLTRVGDRSYFKNALQPATEGRVVLDSIRGRSTGVLRAAFARRSDLHLGAASTQELAAPEPAVVMLTTELQSVTRPPLPRGVGVAILARSGEVLFHSDPTLARSHNFITESQDHTALGELLERGGSGSLALNYWGLPHRAYVRALDLSSLSLTPAGPWSLVVFMDVLPLRSTLFKALVAAGVAAFGLIVGLFVLLSILVILLWGRRVDWLWPHAHAQGAYRWTSLVLLVLAGTFVAYGGEPPSPWPLGPPGPSASVLLAAVAMVIPLTFLLWSFRKASVRGRVCDRFFDKSYRRGFLLASGFFWASFSVLPVCGLARRSAEVALDGLTAARLDSLADHASGREIDNGEKRLEAAHRAQMQKRYLAMADKYGRDFGIRQHSGDLNPRPLAPSSLTDRAFELLLANSYTRETSSFQLSGPRSAPSQGSDGMGVRYRADLHHLTLLSFGELSARQKLLLGGLILLLGWAIYGLSRWSFVNVFFADLGFPESISAGQLFTELRETRNLALLCVTASPEIAEEIRQRGDFAAHADWDSERPTLLGISNLDPPERAAVLDGLNQRQSRGKSTVLLVDRAPLQELQRLKKERSWSATEIAAWTVLLGKFRTAYVREQPATEQEVAEWVGSGAPRWLVEELSASHRVFQACRRQQPSAGQFRVLEREEALRSICDAAWAQYLSLWGSCSQEEQLVLIQLVDEGFVNRRERGVIRELLSRGVLVRRPMLAPFSASFGRFLGIMGQRVDIQKWEAPSREFAWLDLRLPFFTVVAAAGYILFSTQRSWFESVTVFATALATGVIPHLGRLANLLRGGTTRLAQTPSDGEDRNA